MEAYRERDAMGREKMVVRTMGIQTYQCAYPGCDEKAAHGCDNCDAHFCSDHGSKGGDREGGCNDNGSCYGAYAVPSVCWKCGGFNADEGSESELERARR